MAKPIRTSDLPLAVGSSAQGIPVEIDRISPIVKLTYSIADPLGGMRYPLREMADQKVLSNYTINTYDKASFWPAGKAPWNQSYNLEAYFSDDSVDATAVAAGGYYPLGNGKGWTVNQNIIEYSDNGSATQKFTITRTDSQLKIAKTGVTTTTWSTPEFPSGVIPHWVILEIQAAGGAGQTVSGWTSGRPGGAGAWYMCAVCLDYGQVVITMGKSGTASSSNDQTDANNSSVTIPGPTNSSTTITVYGGRGGGNSSYYGCGGTRVDHGSSVNSWKITSLNSKPVAVQLGSYSGGNGTNRPSSESEYDRESWSLKSDWSGVTPLKDATYYECYGSHANGSYHVRGASQPHSGGSGGGCSISGDGGKGAAGIGGSTDIYSAGIGGGGGGGGASNGNGAKGGNWGLWIYY